MATEVTRPAALAPAAPSSLTDRLREVELFSDLDGEQLAWLAEVGRPLRLADGGSEGRGPSAAVYVDRGWVPSPDGVHIDQMAVREGDTATVEGLAFAAPRARGDVDIARLRDSVSYPLLPFIIQQTPSIRPSVSPTVRPLYRWPAPVLDDGPHLSYAIQWFSFAVITLVGTAVLLRKIASESSRTTI